MPPKRRRPAHPERRRSAAVDKLRKKREADNVPTEHAELAHHYTLLLKEVLYRRKEGTALHRLGMAVLNHDKEATAEALDKAEPFLTRRRLSTTTRHKGDRVVYSMAFKLEIIKQCAAAPHGGIAAVLRRYDVKRTTYDKWRLRHKNGTLHMSLKKAATEAKASPLKLNAQKVQSVLLKDKRGQPVLEVTTTPVRQPPAGKAKRRIDLRSFDFLVGEDDTEPHS